MSLVAVSSYSKGAQAAINAFHQEAELENNGYENAMETLRAHFLDSQSQGLEEAAKFSGIKNKEEKDRLKADLAIIAASLLNL